MQAREVFVEMVKQARQE